MIERYEYKKCCLVPCEGIEMLKGHLVPTDFGNPGY